MRAYPGTGRCEITKGTRKDDGQPTCNTLVLRRVDERCFVFRGLMVDLRAVVHEQVERVNLRRTHKRVVPSRRAPPTLHPPKC